MMQQHVDTDASSLDTPGWWQFSIIRVREFATRPRPSSRRVRSRPDTRGYLVSKLIVSFVFERRI